MIFIAEIGINHNGDVKIAKQMIDMVCNACDRAEVNKNEVIIKFQKKNVDKAVPEDQKDLPKDTPWGKTTYYEYKKKIEFNKKEFDDIDKHCKSKGIRWSASAWDVDSVSFLSNYSLPFIKIPSAKIVNENLVKKCAEKFSNMIISTGMSSEKEIEKCVKWIEETWRNDSKKDTQLYIMHCNSSYPAKDSELNLSYIMELKEKYEDRGHLIGYSGHEEGISACLIAKMVGANIFERHITLSRSMWGTDQPASIIYDQLWRLLRDLKKVPIWLGDGVKKVYESELPIKKKLRG